MQDKIELLSVELLDEYRDLTDELKKFNFSLALASGWHYLLDWLWILREIDEIQGKKILDAGAGLGFLQWYLAQNGADLISVDRSNRRALPFHLKRKFQVEGFRLQDAPLTFGEYMNPFNAKADILVKVKGFLRGLVGWFQTFLLPQSKGKVFLYQQDLRFLTDIPSNSIDMIVSISALEHNHPDVLKDVILELERILKPGGKMLVTISAARDKDWFFEPAQGWCYTEQTLKILFRLSDQASSNFDKYDFLMEKLRNSSEMRKFMTWYYYYSPRSGMPWGRWNPRYQPVGVMKVKP